MSEINEAELKQRILDAFDVTEEEVRLFDEATGGPERRGKRRFYEEVVFPYEVAKAEEELSALLPEGLEFRFVEEAY